MSKLWTDLLITMAAIAGGYYLYTKYYGRENRELASTIAGTLIGERLGTVVGMPLGAAGAVGGSVIGGVAGAYVGQELAIKKK